MHWSSLVFWVVVLFGCFASLKNWTAVALVYSWIVGATWTRVTGEGIILEGDIIRDCIVLVVVFTKTHKDCEPTPGPLGWLRDCWPQASRWDKAVVSLFLPMWVMYAFVLNPWVEYWILWSAAVLQFVAAAGEALENWRRGRTQVDAVDPTDLSLSRQGLRYGR